MRIRSLLLAVMSFVSLSPLLAVPRVTAEKLPEILSGQPVARGISYSGYRPGQGPGWGEPSYEQIREDLKLLARHWNVLRLYGSNQHSELILDVIAKENLPLKIMQGLWLTGEVNNPNSPWSWPMSPEQIEWNKQSNAAEVERAIVLAHKYPTIITAFGVGNEVMVDWTDHMVPLPALISYVKRLKENVPQLITVADNYLAWTHQPDDLVQELDFITVHSYPIWEKKPVDEAMAFTKENLETVAEHYPDIPLCIGEAGWTTGTSGVEIPPDLATEANQKLYFDEFTAWTEKEGLVGFFFSAFDEDWKGGSDPAEPEKHWGLFHKDRSPKEAVLGLF